MNDFSDSPYNIEIPEPIFAGSSYDFPFDIHNPFSALPVDLSVAERIEFKITLFGNYDENIALKISSRDTASGIKKINIDNVEKGWVTIHLLPEDTANFVDSWYDFQIKLYSYGGLDDKIIGRGKIKAFKEL